MDMKPRTFILVLTIVSVATIFPLYFSFRQPVQWESIGIGMAQRDLEKIVPRFDKPWNAFGIATKDVDRWGFRWRLTVHKEDERVHQIQKEFMLDGPKPITLWTYAAIGSPQAKVSECTFAPAPAPAPSTSQAESIPGK
jgi:hypothetical protein